ncbi:hypothetical protein SMCF_365, partial [Streptomyces coelicoflavus ZG0656]
SAAPAPASAPVTDPTKPEDAR